MFGQRNAMTQSSHDSLTGRLGHPTEVGVMAMFHQLRKGSYLKSNSMIVLIYPFLALAVIGFIILAVIHVASLSGVTYPFDHLLQFLGPGIFVVFIPTIFVMNRLTRDFKQKDLWRAALRGCPRWMRWSVWAVCGYTWLGFFVLPLLYSGGMDNPANKARSMSGVLMMFYLIPAAVLYSATQVQRLDESRRCLNGHHLSPFAKFCEECGAPAAPADTVKS